MPQEGARVLPFVQKVAQFLLGGVVEKNFSEKSDTIFMPQDLLSYLIRLLGSGHSKITSQIFIYTIST